MRLRGGCHTARKKEEYERMGDRVTKALIRAGAGWRFLDSSPAVYMYRHTVTYQTQKSQLWLQFPDSAPEAAKAPAFTALGNQAWFLAGAGAVPGLPGKGGQWSEKGRSGQGAQVCCELSEFSCAGAR